MHRRRGMHLTNCPLPFPRLPPPITDGERTAPARPRNLSRIPRAALPAQVHGECPARGGGRCRAHGGAPGRAGMWRALLAVALGGESPPPNSGEGGEQARSILKKPPAKNFRKMFSEKKHGRNCFANIRTIHNLTRPPPPESRKIIRAGRSCIFRFSRKRATENICCHAGVCVLCYFPFFLRPDRSRWVGALFSGGALRPTFRRPFPTPEKNIPAWRVLRPARQRRQFVAAASKCVRNPPLFFARFASREKNFLARRVFAPAVHTPPGCRKCVALMSQRYFVFSIRPTAGGQQANRPSIRRRAGLNRAANRPSIPPPIFASAKTFGRARIPPAPAHSPVATDAGEEA